MAVTPVGARLRHVVLADLPASPWRNGGGETREIVCVPAGADMAEFDWRLSVATIARTGPFSAFPGVDRVITLLEGEGVVLRSTDGLIEHALTAPLVPYAFSGDVAMDCELVGACMDFNVMVRRSTTRADVTVQRVAARTAPARAGAFYAAHGTWTVTGTEGESATLAAGTGAYWLDAEAGWRLHPHSTGAALLSVRFESV
ncbi:HutD family protein [Verticiella sediminum]|uniref:HutD family protein n=1 Tax=Verticiella sediminum TaxID=1247510 RepID=A0A556AWT0_9BURK|nr:HutD family protein [Verticiella sediminum]TSH97399.1 HutD family protein [Verticiella sediminum]